MPTPRLKNLPLLKIIEHYLIPWTRQSITSHIVIMPAHDKSLPFGVQVKECELPGPRIPVKNLRAAGHMSINAAQWPTPGLSEKHDPFLLCVLSGHATIQIGTQLLTCNEGTFVFIPPGIAHPDGTRPYSHDGTSCSILWTRRCGSGLRCWISHSMAGNAAPYHGENLYFSHEQLIAAFGALCDELLQGRSGDTCHHSLMLFLLLMQREIGEGRVFDVLNGDKMKQEEPSGFNSDPLQLAERYIRSNLSSPITIEMAARHVHMSRANFARLFRQHTGQTFLEYLHRLRLQQACTFLLETTWTVRSIAELCGFASESGFSRFFTKQMGVTPLTYRKTQ